jgi:ubiquinone/menaquinone biosynthesis C-methylase UbiE
LEDTLTQDAQDRWAEWLLNRRDGSDSEQRRRTLQVLKPVRNQVLDHAQLRVGDTLLDVGTGDGLIAFGALDRVAESGRVLFSDISQDLLNHCRDLAEDMKVTDRCEFLCASAQDLSSIESNSVDAVTTRSVLIYVDEKRKAFEEFYRVLKPGGRLSCFEPINSFAYPEPKNTFMGFDAESIQDLSEKVKNVYRTIQPPSDPMLNFNERDLVFDADAAGFEEVHARVHIDIAPGGATHWERWLTSAGNPKIPTIQEAIDQSLTSAEKQRFLDHLRPLVESGQRARVRTAIAYLWALKH